ncbi:hypothetical protein PIB30_030206 [Stylosanthes scabra]|uniref:Uncharacterized protein n=1 Tax=Stylosanthes scabra TaxID=79078 RepID=A0ABU6UAX5_9FABA|nr:hypothetical protein [Stylosanthes scabra]
MVDLNMPPEDSIDDSNPKVNAPTKGIGEEDLESHERSMVHDPTMHSYHTNPDFDGEEIEVEPVNVDAEDGEKTNYFTHGQPTLTQPAITVRYDHLAHFTTLNLGAMRSDNSFGQGGPDDDPTSEFECHSLRPVVNKAYAFPIAINTKMGSAVVLTPKKYEINKRYIHHERPKWARLDMVEKVQPNHCIQMQVYLVDLAWTASRRLPKCKKILIHGTWEYQRKWWLRCRWGDSPDDHPTLGSVVRLCPGLPLVLPRLYLVA